MGRARAAAAVALCLIAAGASAFGARAERPLYTIASTPVPPQIDGRIDDPCWQAATRYEVGAAAPAEGLVLCQG